MPYVDGFVIPLPKNKVDDYQKMASMAGKIWIEHGALEFRECVADDFVVDDGQGNKVSPFPQLLNLKDNETAMFSWIVFKSRTDRDRINGRVLKDPRMAEMGGIDTMPFDIKRMASAGFKTIVDMGQGHTPTNGRRETARTKKPKRAAKKR